MRHAPAPPARWQALGRHVCFGLALSCLAHDAAAQGPPEVVPHLEMARLAGEWFEISTTGTWWHRRCLSDTRYRFEALAGTTLRVSSTCTTHRAAVEQRGRLRAADGGGGRLSISFAPRIFAWLPVTWSDFWVLAAADDLGWLLVGDNRRERLSILSRTLALDEAAIAQALAAARQQGYGIERLARVPHPAGPTGLRRPR